MNHGAQEHWQAELLDDQLGSNEIPQVHMFSEGNGGEMRLSYHGYPKGYTQIVESPDTYMIAPMQIDTWNRNMKNSSFLPGPLLRSSRIPPEAGYSGLLECPCTDRIDFELGMTYSFDNCTAPVQNQTECFSTVKQLLKSEHYHTKEVHNKILPRGCSGAFNEKGDVQTFWNVADYIKKKTPMRRQLQTVQVLLELLLALSI